MKYATFRCYYCIKTFATRQRVREHELRIHEQVLNMEDMKCKLCDMQFTNRRNYLSHAKRHENPNSRVGKGF